MQNVEGHMQYTIYIDNKSVKHHSCDGGILFGFTKGLYNMEKCVLRITG